ncbi:MAG: bifunctional 5,10-methylene-tetrahydrofolate dehydrogenase/5,10-methylene-tetrahydrofolate cyclohydrolase [Eggerthellaceae bacterium]|nr:bifunctional 5,10-methylene-tetrahydrofolate dehydrogenase/5,10-methylene-tetrahydrofolate cyclohydrolase [Eggerthellaceae bacterium]
MATMLTGKPVIEAMREDLLTRVAALAERGVTPGLAIVRVGERPDDLSYERTAVKRAEGLGIAVRVEALPADATQAQLEAVIDAVNDDASIHGCLLFRPLPAQMDERAVCDRLAAAKDVDGISSASLAGVFADTGEGFPPATAQACLEVLDHYGIPVAGRHVVVVGRSLVIGRPVALMLLARHATVTLCHSRTERLAAHMAAADIVVCATGRARGFGPECFAPGQVVLDVGINFDDEGALCGDVDAAAVEAVLGPEGALTPVPGGIGGVTTSVTMVHVVAAAERAAR